jgi:hypothetical protein
MTIRTVLVEEPSFLKPSLSLAKLSTSAAPNLDFLSRYCVGPPSAVAQMVANDAMTALPPSFNPTDFDIVCGRGKGHYNRPGCKRLREIIRAYIPQYTAARTKLDKSSVVSCILETVKDQENARFVKCKKGIWYELSDDQAREKVGHTMREAIALFKSLASSPPVAPLTPSLGFEPACVVSNNDCNETSMMYVISSPRKVSPETLETSAPEPLWNACFDVDRYDLAFLEA